MLVLRDGRKLIGVLRSWDQFANLVLQDTVERIYAGTLFADEPRGIYLVRGENVLLLGEIVRRLFLFLFLYIAVLQSTVYSLQSTVGKELLCLSNYLDLNRILIKRTISPCRSEKLRLRR